MQEKVPIFKAHIVVFAVLLTKTVLVGSMLDFDRVKLRHDYEVEEDEEEDVSFERGWLMDDDIQEWERSFQDYNGSRHLMGHFSRYNSSYFVVAPLVVRPTSVYQVVVCLLKGDAQALITASLTVENNEVAHTSKTATVGELTVLMMKVPKFLKKGNAVLKVEGREGSSRVFYNSTVVTIDSRHLNVLVQMSRPLFTGGQEVKFRAILLGMDMKPVEEPVEIFALDAKGYIIRRWVSRIPMAGVVDLGFQLPNLPSCGWWRIRVIAGTQKEEHPFLVQKFYIPRFEIYYDMPYYTLTSEEEISGVISSCLTNDAPVTRGNITLHLLAKKPWAEPDSKFQLITTETYEFVDEHEFSFPMSLVEELIGDPEETEVRVESILYDALSGMRINGFCSTRLISPKIHIRLLELETLVFKPGMPLELTLLVSHDDSHPLEEETLKSSRLEITTVVITDSKGSIHLPQEIIPSEEEGKLPFSLNDLGSWATDYYSFEKKEEIKFNLLNQMKFAEYRKTGVYGFTLEVPTNSSSLEITVIYSDEEGGSATGVFRGLPFQSALKKYFHVSCSNEKIKVGEFAIFHIRANFLLDKFHYVVMAKGVVLYSSSQKVNLQGKEVIFTLPLVVSREMVPQFTVLVFHITEEGEVLSDSLSVPVELFQELPITLKINQHKDHHKRTVEVSAGSIPGAYYAFSCARELNYQILSRNRLTKAQVLKAALAFEPNPSNVHAVTRKSRDGNAVESIQNFPVRNKGRDTLRTFHLAGLTVMGDVQVYDHYDIGTSDICNATLGYFKCGDNSSCYRFEDLCDGILQCSDGFDEQGCIFKRHRRMHNETHKIMSPEVSDEERFRITRHSWWKDLFDEDDGDFCWTNKFIGYLGLEEITLEVPKTEDDWVLEGFASHPEFGFAISQIVPYTTTPPVFMVVEAPEFCRRGEQVGIRVAIFNTLLYNLMVLLMLPASEDYQFIQIEEHGEVSHYSPRLMSGDHEHMLFMEAEGVKEVFLPLAITKQIGLVQIPIKLMTQVASDEEPEGAPVRKHTSLIVDLKNRATVYEFLDIPVNEIPEIANSLQRLFVYGSPRARVTISGDVFGPTKEDIQVHYDEAFNGRMLESTDGLAFNFGATVWTLHYLRLTKQLNMDNAHLAFEYLNVQLAGLLTRYQHGAFSMWHYSPPSIWLTSWVIFMFEASRFEDWENYIFLDPKTISESVDYILSHQNNDGSFYETRHYSISLDKKVEYKVSGAPVSNMSIALTAHVVSSIKGSLEMLPGPVRIRAVKALQMAKKFLEGTLPFISDPYDLAITAWALTVVKSPERNLAVKMLDVTMRQRGNMAYWSRRPIEPNQRSFENNQRNFLFPKESQEWDSHAIEATSYALLTFLSHEGVTHREEIIVNWLHSVRDWDIAFSSTLDTVIAMRALVEYCNLARVREVTDLKLSVESTSSPESSQEIIITQSGVSDLQNIEIPNGWGHVFLIAKGSGQAVAQLEVMWGVDVEKYLRQPPGEYFHLEVKENYHQFKNKSIITTTVCTMWIGTHISHTSHATMLEVEIPTGYILYQPTANLAVKKAKYRGHFPQLVDAKSGATRVFWNFEYVPSNSRQCFSYEMKRWYPAANLTAVRSATIFEIFSPERFQTVIINSTSLSALDICEVCGSYQCPYCSLYSAACHIHNGLYSLIYVYTSSWLLYNAFTGIL